jgi:hypothetical protein
VGSHCNVTLLKICTRYCGSHLRYRVIPSIVEFDRERDRVLLADQADLGRRPDELGDVITDSTTVDDGQSV